MSIQTRTDETVSTDAPTTTTDADDLATIVAQTTPIGEQFPDFDEFRMVCRITKDTIGRVAAEDL